MPRHVQMQKTNNVRLSLQYFKRWSFFTGVLNWTKLKKSVESGKLFHMLTTLLQKAFSISTVMALFSYYVFCDLAGIDSGDKLVNNLEQWRCSYCTLHADIYLTTCIPISNYTLELGLQQL